MKHAPELPPSLQEFAYRDAVTVLGVEHIGLEHREHGARVIIPEHNLDVIAERPEIGDLIGRVATFAAEHNGYRDYNLVTNTQDVVALRSADVNPEWDRHNTSSVYRDTESNQIIKAYDLAPDHDPHTQHAVMARLSKELNHRPYKDGLRLSAAEPYALISPRGSNHKTAIIENVGGTSINKMLTYDYERTREGRLARGQNHLHALTMVNDAVRSQIPASLRPFLSDLTRGNSMHNIHVNVPEKPLTSDTVRDALDNLREGRIFDQPGATPTTIALGRVARTSKLAKLLN